MAEVQARSETSEKPRLLKGSALDSDLFLSTDDMLFLIAFASLLKSCFLLLLSRKPSVSSCGKRRRLTQKA